MTSEELKELVEGVKNNDPKATEKLCKCFEPLIKAQSKRYTNTTTSLEDAISLSWIVFLEFIKSYKDNDFKKLPGLLRQVVKTKLLNAVTSKCNFDGRMLYVDDFANYIVEDERLERAIENSDLSKALLRLKKHEKQFVYLRYYKDLSYKQIARILKKSEYTLLNKNVKVLQKLKHLMNK